MKKFKNLDFIIDPTEDVESYDRERQQIEINKCSQSFSYFCAKYVKLCVNQTILSCELFDYQRRIIQEFELHQYNVLRKFRNSRLTTTTGFWVLWQCLFKRDQHILWVARTDQDILRASNIISKTIDYLPSWLKSKVLKNKDYSKGFENNNIVFLFNSSTPSIGKKLSCVIVDEAAFIPNLQNLWMRLLPCLDNNGKCVLMSSVNGNDDLFARTYHAAKLNRNNFHHIDVVYTEHPNFKDEEYVNNLRLILGEKAWNKEILCSFDDI